MKTTQIIEIAYSDVRLFNALAGNLTNVTDDSVDAQLGFIFEELTETIDALESGDRVELLDGACDLFVTVSGLMQKLEAQGYDVARAIERVNENNLSKFPKTISDVDRAQYNVTLNEQYNRYVLKDAIGKVKKPSDFVGVYLTDLIPSLRKEQA
jgi:phosphoribosyl-ATP pyrophosphohydrolase